MLKNQRAPHQHQHLGLLSQDLFCFAPESSNGNLGPMKASVPKKGSSSLFWIQAIKKTGYFKILWLISSLPLADQTRHFRDFQGIPPCRGGSHWAQLRFPQIGQPWYNPMNQHARTRPKSRHFPNVLLGQFLHALFGNHRARVQPTSNPFPWHPADAAVCSARAGSVPVTSTAEVVRIHFSIWISVIACA